MNVYDKKTKRIQTQTLRSSKKVARENWARQSTGPANAANDAAHLQTLIIEIEDGREERFPGELTKLREQLLATNTILESK